MIFRVSSCIPAISHREDLGRTLILNEMPSSDSFIENIRKSAFSTFHTEGDILQGCYQEILQKYDNHDDDNRREIDPKLSKRKPFSDGIENGFGDPVKKLNNRIVRVGTDPGNQGPDNNDPHIKIKGKVENGRQSMNEISRNEHTKPLRNCLKYCENTFRGSKSQVFM